MKIPSIGNVAATAGIKKINDQISERNQAKVRRLIQREENAEKSNLELEKRLNDVQSNTQENQKEFEKGLEIHRYNDRAPMDLEETSMAQMAAELCQSLDESIEDSLKTLDSGELDMLFEYADDEQHEFKNKTEKFAEELMESAEDTEMGSVEEFIQGNQLSSAQIYILLNYIFNKLQRKKRKEEFKKALAKLINDYQSQESAYLFEFFALNKNQQLSDKLSAQGINYVAKLNSGNVSLTNIKDAVNFIEQTFVDLGNIVSLYMKIRARQIKMVNNGEKLTKENKFQLSELLRIESHLISVQSLHLSIKKMRKVLVNSKQIELNASDIQALKQILGFLETPFISEVQINTLFRNFNIQNINTSKYLSLLNGILTLARSLPLSLYNNDPKTFQTFSNGILKILRIKSKESELNKQQLQPQGLINKKKNNRKSAIHLV